MSVKHTAWVWEHSRAEGGTLLVALALADSVNHLDGSDECWPKREVLARRVRLSKSQVTRCLTELEQLGEVERRRTRDGNHYRLLMPKGANCAERTDAQSEDAPMLTLDDAPMRPSRVEPEDLTGKEPEQELTSLFVEWATVSGQPDAQLSPARRRLLKKLLTEEPDVEVLKQALRGYAAYARRRYPGKKWDLGNAFSTFKGKDAEGRPVHVDLRSQINWMVSLNEKAKGERSLAETQQRMRDANLDPERGLRWLEDARIHRGRQRGQEARERLESYGFTIIESSERPYLRLDW